MTKNTTCKVCGKKYHNCNNCGMKWWSNYFCSERCRDASWQPYVNNIKRILHRCYKYNKDDVIDLVRIINEEYEDIIGIACHQFLKEVQK